MTDRIKALTVVLEEDYRDDDVENIITAILMVRGVLDVTDRYIDSIEDHIAYSRVRRELGEKLIRVLYPKDDSQ